MNSKPNLKRLFWLGMGMMAGAVLYFLLRYPGIAFGFIVFVVGESIVRTSIDEASKHGWNKLD